MNVLKSKTIFEPINIDSAIDSVSSMFFKKLNSDDFSLPEDIKNIEFIESKEHFFYILKNLCVEMTLEQINTKIPDFKKLKDYRSIFYKQSPRIKSLLIKYFSENDHYTLTTEITQNLNEIIRVRKKIRSLYIKNYHLITCILLEKSNLLTNMLVIDLIEKNKLERFYYYFIASTNKLKETMLKKDPKNYIYLKNINSNLIIKIFDKLSMQENIEIISNNPLIFRDTEVLGLFFNKFSSSIPLFKDFCKRVEDNLGANDLDKIYYSSEKRVTKVLTHFDSNYFSPKLIENEIINNFNIFKNLISPSLEICIFALKIEENEIINQALTSEFNNQEQLDSLIEKEIENRSSLYKYVKIVENKSHRETLDLLMAKLEMKNILNAN